MGSNPAILEGLPYTLSLSLIGFALGTFVAFRRIVTNVSRLPITLVSDVDISLMRWHPTYGSSLLHLLGLPFYGNTIDAILYSPYSGQ